jgi:biopolymer transport protein TolQ
LSLTTTIAMTTNPGAMPDLFQIFLEVGLVGKAIFVVLVALSIGSWTVMLAKWIQLQRAKAATKRFLEVFRKSRRFSEVHAATSKYAASPLVGLFQAGYVDVDAQVKAMRDDEVAQAPRYRVKSLTGVERSLRRAMTVELTLLQKGASFLATTAAASPFIGLFGTVWGIMLAFLEIGRSGSTSLVAVAPGIAEALINTATGLAAAIPALIGYNLLGTRIKLIRAEMEDFILEFLNLTERNFT